MSGSNDTSKSGGCSFRSPDWFCGEHRISPLHRPLVMGIINLTPDSFYTTSRCDGVQPALEQALGMAAAGADILDLGAESSRPGAEPVSADEECGRLLPALEAIRAGVDLPLTVDTVRAETARLALEAGADGINDISAGVSDPDMLPLAADTGCGLVLMHMLGRPKTMQEKPAYEDVVSEVRRYLRSQVAAAEAAGVRPQRICIDPGIGFGKDLEHNLMLLAGLEQVAEGRPLLLGASRKSFIEHLTGAAPDDRLGGSLAALAAAFSGGAALVRVHDVGASVQFLETLAAVSAHGPTETPESPEADIE